MDIPIREYEHPSASDTSVYSPRHLQNLVGAEVQSGEDILSALDDVAEAGVIDDDCVESVNVERALTRCRHRQEVGLLLLALEKRSNDPDRLATVVKSAIDAGKPLSDELGSLLHAGSSWKKHPNSATLLDHLLQKSIVEERQRIFTHDFHVRCLRGIEGGCLEHGGGVEVLRVKSRVDGCR